MRDELFREVMKVWDGEFERVMEGVDELIVLGWCHAERVGYELDEGLVCSVLREERDESGASRRGHPTEKDRESI